MAVTSSNLFHAARNKKPVSAKKPSKAEIGPKQVDGLATYAALDALDKKIKTLKETVRADITDQMFQEFINNSSAASFKGKDGKATASLELRRRSSNSGLDENEVKICKRFKITTKVVEDKAETYIINPEYANDLKLLERVSDALQNVKGLPKDFLMFQESTKKVVATEDSLADAFKHNDPDRVQSLLQIVGVPAIKAQTSASTKELLREISDLIKE